MRTPSPRKPPHGWGILRRAAALLAAGAVAMVVFGAPELEEAEAREGASARLRGRFEHGCRVQPPQASLERRSFVNHRILDGEKHLHALRYFAEHYGNAGDAFTTSIASDAASSHATRMRFMGLPISVHEKIAPALACVEKHIERTCKGKRAYTPKAIGGFRNRDTIRGAEVSNHLFGIAIDIDPDRNPCCGCVDPWPNHPACRDRDVSALARSSLPECWVRGFERFGFDWLGHDALEDTMHFEFLGDPDRIKK